MIGLLRPTNEDFKRKVYMSDAPYSPPVLKKKKKRPFIFPNIMLCYDTSKSVRVTLFF